MPAPGCEREGVSCINGKVPAVVVCLGMAHYFTVQGCDAFGVTPAGGALDTPAGAMHMAADTPDWSAGAVHVESGLDRPAADPWTAFKGWRLWGEAQQHVRFGIDGEIVEGTVLVRLPVSADPCCTGSSSGTMFVYASQPR